MDVLQLTCDLMRRRSVTPLDAGCLVVVADLLSEAGFRLEWVRQGAVENLWATHGSGGRTLAFVGHTDVVPSGPEEDWTTPPFCPAIRDGLLFGRGAADMKGALAAMVVALCRFVRARPQHEGAVALLLTSSEEKASDDAVPAVVRHLEQTGQRIDWCVVGEASSNVALCDAIRVGRRGSLSGTVIVKGVQGHVAYPEQALNPIHAFAPALLRLSREIWDTGNADFPPTTFQVSNINAGTGATNVIPGELVAKFNLRYGTANTEQALRERIEAILHEYELDTTVEWQLAGLPFLAPANGHLRTTVAALCKEVRGREPAQDTGGGTSDGRYIAPMGAEVIELGPVNATIHKVDEHIRVADLELLPDVYEAICERML